MKKLNLFLLICIVILIHFTIDVNNKSITGINSHDMDNIWSHAPPSITMTEFLLKSSRLWNVPYLQLRNSSRLETNFKGYLQFTYDPYLTSSANAEGPMQVLLPTARYMNPEIEFDREYLRTNIPFNTYTGAKYARYLYDKYRSWLKVWSYYNQGHKGLTSINSYARYVAYNTKL